MQCLNKATIKAMLILFAIIISFTPSITQALTLTDSPPITVTANGQIIENVRIVAIGELSLPQLSEIGPLSGRLVTRALELVPEGSEEAGRLHASKNNTMHVPQALQTLQIISRDHNKRFKAIVGRN